MTRKPDPLLDRVRKQVPLPTPTFGRLQARREAKARAARLRAGALGLAIAGALIGALVVWAPFGQVSTGVTGSAEGSQIPLVAAPGEYYYVRLASWYSETGDGPLRPSTLEFWYGPDDSGRVVPDQSGDAHDERFSPGEMPLEALPGLSTDPATLMGQLMDRGSPGGASPNPIATTSPGRSQSTTSLLRTLQDLLGMGDQFLTPKQVAAVFEGAQSIEGVSTQSDASDPLGRPAIRLSFVIDYNQGAGSRVNWYFDPQTKQWMGEAWIDQGTGQVTSARLVQMAGIASSIETRPAPEARYVSEGSSTPAFIKD
jgi:hypothetical protein